MFTSINSSILAVLRFGMVDQELFHLDVRENAVVAMSARLRKVFNPHTHRQPTLIVRTLVGAHSTRTCTFAFPRMAKPPGPRRTWRSGRSPPSAGFAIHAGVRLEEAVLRDARQDVALSGALTAADEDTGGGSRRCGRREGRYRLVPCLRIATSPTSRPYCVPAMPAVGPSAPPRTG
jgi:hypothetical protein